jgi:divalent metal cation (Fe/Co/Zn/Cd) transporter
VNRLAVVESAQFNLSDEAVDVKFQPELSVRELESIIDGIEATIRKHEPAVVRVFIQVDSLRGSGQPVSHVG